MVVLELHGSGGHIFADVTDEQAKKADLGVGKCFLAPIGKLEEQKMQKYFCKKCESEFDGSPKIQIEESPNEPVADGLIFLYNYYKLRGTVINAFRCNSILKFLITKRRNNMA